LAPGTYKLRVVVDGLTPVAWSDTGQPLKLPPATVVSVTIGDPQTPAERTAGYRQLGHAAKRRGQLDDAEVNFRRAADAGGDGSTGLYDLGNIYLERKKYREAIDCFERLLPGASHGISFVPQMLAEAYVGVGDGGNAVRVLNGLGMPPERIAAEMDQLRQSVSRRNSR
jgi:tetratricopeptide (TPR) repeat protein